MPKQTRNKNLTQNTRKNDKKTGDSKTNANTGWNPADDTEKNAKRTARHNRKRPSRQNRSLEKSRGMKTHASTTNRTNFDMHGSKENWIWGHHAVKAALENPRRTHHKLYISPTMLTRLKDCLSNMQGGFRGEMFKTHPSEIDAMLPSGAVHQGAALLSAPLPAYDLNMIAEPAKGLIVVLDQITDPHNVGAIFRLAAAFGAKAIIMQTRNAPPLAGAVTKVAVGTVETVPHVLVTNIANTLLSLQKSGWRVTGLAGEANITLEQAFTRAEAEVIVMGAEGPGLRKRVRDCCDQLAKILMPGSEKSGAESLNVSTAAGIALYEAARTIAAD